MRRPPRWSARRRPVKVLLGAVAGVLVAASAACGTPVEPVEPGSVAVVTASHDDELAPTLGAADVALLGAHARSARGRDDIVGLYVVGADPADTTRIDLAPRRLNGQVEMGTRREALIEERVGQVAEAVDAHVRAGGEPDLLGAFGAATRTDASRILILTGGLAPGRGWDLRLTGWDVAPATLVAQLHAAGALPDARGRTVVLSGLGRTAGDQPVLGLREQQRLRDLWLAVCVATGARCEIVDDVRPVRPALSPEPGPIVDVPRIATEDRPDGTTAITIPSSVLFDPDSCALVDPPGAAIAVADVVARLRSEDETVTVSGRTAPVGDDGVPLATCRARLVADLLIAAGVDPLAVRDVRGDGSGADPPEAARDGSGRLDPTIFPALRRVVLTLTPREMP